MQANGSEDVGGGKWRFHGAQAATSDAQGVHQEEGGAISDDMGELAAPELPEDSPAGSGGLNGGGRA